MAPRGDHHSLAGVVTLSPHFGLGQRHLTDQPSPANPGSIPPLGTILKLTLVTIRYSYLAGSSLDVVISLHDLLC